MRLPDFYIIGAAKAGTTSLHAILAEHPELFLSDPKEPEFFARDDLYAEGLEHYAKMFDAAGPRLAGEASTLYTLSPFFPEAAERISAATPGAKFIYMMRDPIDRAYSFYIQLLKNRQNATGETGWTRSFEDLIRPERRNSGGGRSFFAPWDAHLPDDPNLCVAGSDYLLRLAPYLERFPRDRFLFLKFEEFRRDPVEQANRAASFLGVAPVPPASQAVASQNVSAEHFEEVAKTEKIRRARDLAGPLWRLRHAVPPAVRNWLRDRVSSGADASHAAPPPMKPETWDGLEKRFRPMISPLEDITGLTFEDWMVRPPRPDGP